MRQILHLCEAPHWQRPERKGGSPLLSETCRCGNNRHEREIKSPITTTGCILCYKHTVNDGPYAWPLFYQKTTHCMNALVVISQNVLLPVKSLLHTSAGPHLIKKTSYTQYRWARMVNYIYDTTPSEVWNFQVENIVTLFIHIGKFWKGDWFGNMDNLAVKGLLVRCLSIDIYEKVLQQAKGQSVSLQASCILSTLPTCHSTHVEITALNSNTAQATAAKHENQFSYHLPPSASEDHCT